VQQIGCFRDCVSSETRHIAYIALFAYNFLHERSDLKNVWHVNGH